MAKSNTALVAYKAGIRARSKKPKRRFKGKVSLAVALSFIPLVSTTYQGFMRGGELGGVSQAAGAAMRALTGFEPGAAEKWRLDRMYNGLIPIVVGIGIHKLASKTGVNRAMGRFIPWVNI